MGSWASYEMVLRYAHLAADHLRGAACRIGVTFAPQTKNPQLVRVSQRLEANRFQVVAGKGVEPPTRGNKISQLRRLPNDDFESIALH